MRDAAALRYLPPILRIATRPLFKRCVAWILERETGVDNQTFVDHMQVIGLWPDYKITVSQEMYRTFGNDTYPLLDFVYKTAPMRSAAPNEYLNFALAIPNKSSKNDEESMNAPALSKRQQRLRKERLETMHEKLKAKRLSRTNDAVYAKPKTPPRIDDVFLAGQQWLDELSGGAVPTSTGEWYLPV